MKRFLQFIAAAIIYIVIAFVFPGIPIFLQFFVYANLVFVFVMVFPDFLSLDDKSSLPYVFFATFYLPYILPLICSVASMFFLPEMNLIFKFMSFIGIYICSKILIGLIGFIFMFGIGAVMALFRKK